MVLGDISAEVEFFKESQKGFYNIDAFHELSVFLVVRLGKGGEQVAPRPTDLFDKAIVESSAQTVHDHRHTVSGLLYLRLVLRSGGFKDGLTEVQVTVACES